MAKSVFVQNEYVWQYGRKNERSLTLYPMSMADQLKVTDVLAAVINTVVATSRRVAEGDAADVEFLKAVAGAVRDNFTRVAAIISNVDEEDPAIKDLPNHVTNMQFMDFVNYVWETNYGSVRKNFDNLFELLKNIQK